MKKGVLLFLAILSGSLLFSAFRSPSPTPAAAGIKWMTWEEAMIANKKAPKKIMVDVYTDWCGWCKKMDGSTFIDPKVVEYVSKNFYAVKFNAEQKEPIQFQGREFKYMPSGRRGVHELAYSLLEGNLGYPSIVYLNEKLERIMISPGFKQVDAMLKELKFAKDEIYKKSSWDEYKNSN